MYFQTIKLVLKKIKGIQNVTIRIVTCLKYCDTYHDKNSVSLPGADPGEGGPPPARAPLKIGKNMIFWLKIVIFHTKYPKNVRASLRSAQFV